MSDGGEGFLTRWSRLKRTEAIPSDAPPMPVAEASPAPAEAGPDDRPRDPETGALIDTEWVSTLPRLEDLGPGADLSGFMRAGVPEALRREALRRLWEIDPVIRDFVSPALDYAYDYNTPGAAPGYGPLSEADVTEAKRFLEAVFSDPPGMRANAQTNERVCGYAPDCDVESQGVTVPPAMQPAADDAQGPVAARHETQPHLTADLVEPGAAMAEAAKIQSIQVVKDDPGHAAAQHEPGPGDAGPSVRRRRGGTATPA